MINMELIFYFLGIEVDILKKFKMDGTKPNFN